LLPPDRGVDLVIGSRFCNGNGQEVPSYRKVGMKVLDFTTNFLGGLSVTDTQSGFRANGKRVIDCICIDDDGISAGSEILLHAKDNRPKVGEVMIHLQLRCGKGLEAEPCEPRCQGAADFAAGYGAAKAAVLFHTAGDDICGGGDWHRSGAAQGLLSVRAAQPDHADDTDYSGRVIHGFYRYYSACHLQAD